MNSYFTTSRISILRQALQFCFVTLIAIGTGCKSSPSNTENPNANAGGGSSILIKGKLSSCYTADSLRVFELLGNDARLIGAGKIEQKGAEGTFSFNLSVPSAGVYLIGPNPNQQLATLVVLGGETEVSFNADCSRGFAQSAQIQGSKMNESFSALMRAVNNYHNQTNMLAQNRQIFMQSDPAQVPRIQTQLDAEFNKLSKTLDSLARDGGPISTATLLYRYNFFPDPAKTGPDELKWLTEHYFDGVDHTKPEFGYQIGYFEKGKNFALFLAARGYQNLLPELNRVADLAPAASRNRQILLLSFLNGLEQARNDEAYLEIGNRLLKEYPAQTGAMAQLKAKLDQMARLGKGAVAPEIDLTQPSGVNLKLSSLKGKVVLVDFWASWCGPCRRENPNVVKAYNKYHSAGFEILGVSLDTDKGKWMDAIQKDGLLWKHVSDLGGWQSVAAKTYEVSSIPATVLLDKEGKIIARNLRGPALEEKLKEIFGF